MSDKHLVIKADFSGDYTPTCFVIFELENKDTIMTYLRLLQKINAELIQNPYVKQVNYQMNWGIGIYCPETEDVGYDFAEEFEESAMGGNRQEYVSYKYTNDDVWDKARELDCGLCTRIWGDWVQFRAYLSDESSEEVWLDIKIDELEKLLNGGEA